MQRRHYLALGFLAVCGLLAGCSAPGSLSMTPAANDSVIAEQASIDIDSVGEDDRVAIADPAIAGGRPTVTDRRPPIETDGRPIQTERGYYDLSWTIVGNETRTQYDVRFDIDPNETDGRSITVDALPAVDREHVPIDHLRTLLSDDGDTRPPAIGFSEVYTASERNRSVLVPDNEYDVLIVDGQAVGIANDGQRDVTVHTYRYESTQVASDDSELATALRSRSLFTLDGLADAERKIVADAIGDTHYEEGSRSAAWDDLVDRFTAHDAVFREYSRREYLVRYDGTTYWAVLSDIDLDTDDRSPPAETPAETPPRQDRS